MAKTIPHKKTVCVDLDGVLATYTTWKGACQIGEPIPGAKEFLTELMKTYEVIIYTNRINPEHNMKEVQRLLSVIGMHDTTIGADTVRTFLTNLVRGWLKAHELPFDRIHNGDGKPMCIAFVDDRAVYCHPQEDDVAFAKALGIVHILADRKPTVILDND